MENKEVALIVGSGSGLSASLARKFSSNGLSVMLAARNVDKLEDLTSETGATTFQCDTADSGQVQKLFENCASTLGPPKIVVFNASARVRGPITDIDPDEAQSAILTTAYGGFLVGREAAKVMVEKGSGSIFFTGASAGVKGFPNSSVFAVGKFGLRGLAQSMARELHPKNIHVMHIVVDGGIKNVATGRVEGGEDQPDKWLDPDAIADTYWHLHSQHRSSWSWEIEVRPWVEKF